MTAQRPTALIAEDEPLLREALARLLKEAWPELEVVAQARSGREAVEAFEAQSPDICFLDVHMPGMSGLEAARLIGRRAHLVFVTAYHKYAVQAFEEGALDYLVKPVEPARLADTVSRLQERLRAAAPFPDAEALLARIAERLAKDGPALALRWLRVSAGKSVRMVAVEDIVFLKSDEKYTLVAWQSGSEASEGLVRTPLKELAAQLDPEQFIQVHRAVVVNLKAISHVVRGENETAAVHLKHRSEVLPVSRTFLHHFRQM
ncbi:MAG: response regulator transcription factor [Holophagaceae bacterium]|nr:response regulator transcription factor [Holophagaceae bacterium]